jgi:hypothetical protein
MCKEPSFSVGMNNSGQMLTPVWLCIMDTIIKWSPAWNCRICLAFCLYNLQMFSTFQLTSPCIHTVLLSVITPYRVLVVNTFRKTYWLHLNVPPRRSYAPTRLHGGVTKKVTLSIFIAVKILNLIIFTLLGCQVQITNGTLNMKPKVLSLKLREV